MSIPDFKTYRRLAGKGKWVIFSKSISADLETPVSAFLKLCGTCGTAFLFESVEHGDRIGRYSLLGTNPRQIIRYDGDRTYIQNRPFVRKETVYVGDPTTYMQLASKSFSIANPLPVPIFQGGYVGYLGYEAVEDFESVRLRTKPSVGVPKAIFYFIDEFLIFDHVNHVIQAVVTAPAEGNLKREYESAVARMDKLIAQLEKAVRIRTVKEKNQRVAIRSNLTKRRFLDHIKRIKDYIVAGDCIQVVLSQRFNLGRVRTPFQVYRALRSLNPSPYMFYLKHHDFHLVGSSPEVLIKKTGQEVELRPIAGTRPRGEDEETDKALEKELQDSVKEHAEHLMLVDLGRNDIGRVCEFNTIRVKEYARVERYSHVMHLVSDVIGKLCHGRDMYDLLRSTFPAGTVTGAPKIRAMQIIDELEPTERGPYAGSVGYLSLSGDMDMCITIRTILIHKGQASVQAGAGIVYDSDPQAEYTETVNKAKALFRAVEQARQGKCDDSFDR